MGLWAELGLDRVPQHWAVSGGLVGVMLMAFDAVRTSAMPAVHDRRCDALGCLDRSLGRAE